jgi:hypothetical protein
VYNFFSVLFDDDSSGTSIAGDNILLYYVEQMIPIICIAGGSTGVAKENRSLAANKLQNSDFCIIMGAGGMNNETCLAENIGYELYTGEQSHSLAHAVYLFSRLSPIQYDLFTDDNVDHDKTSSDDPLLIRTAFLKKGRNDFKKGTIATAGAISLLLSANTYSICCGKDLRTLYNFRLPDVYSYITTRGMSYKLVSGYQVNKDLRFLFGLETVLKIDQATEYHIGIDHIFRLPLPVRCKLVFTFGQGLDLESRVQIPISPSFTIGFGLEHYTSSSLDGQRNITSNIFNNNPTTINENITSTDVYGFILYRY